MTKQRLIGTSSEDTQTQYRKDFIGRMERKWELKKSLQDSRHHRHLFKLNRQPDF